MDQFEFIRKINIERFQSLLATSVDDAERRTIQILLAKEAAKEALRTSKPKMG
jgi:hypothetical protein